MCIGCGDKDHEGKLMYARTNENSRDAMEHHYVARPLSYTVSSF